MPVVEDSSVFQDKVAMSVARAITAANREAEARHLDISHGTVSVRAIRLDGKSAWRVSYMPEDPTLVRGGDLMIDVRADDASVVRVLQGQ